MTAKLGSRQQIWIELRMIEVRWWASNLGTQLKLSVKRFEMQKSFADKADDHKIMSPCMI